VDDGGMAPLDRRGMEGSVALYRAVQPIELADIQESGRFVRGRSSIEGKYFTTTAQGAASYAKQAFYGFGDDAYTLVRTAVSSQIFSELDIHTVDMNVPSVIIAEEVLPLLQPEILNFFPMP
jgi:hypothetical protein